MLAEVLSVAFRALSFVCALQAGGVAIFLATFWRALSPGSLRAIQRIGLLSAAAGLVLVAVQYSLESARMAGELAGMADISLQKLVLSSTTAAAAGLRLVGLLLVAFGVRRAGNWPRLCAVGGAVLIAASFALTGHTSAHPERWLLAPLLVIHLLVVELWFGALLPLHTVSIRESSGTAARVIEAFSAAAIWLVPSRGAMRAVRDGFGDPLPRSTC